MSGIAQLIIAIGVIFIVLEINDISTTLRRIEQILRESKEVE